MWYNTKIYLLRPRWHVVLLFFFFQAAVCVANDNFQLLEDAANGDREAQYTLAHLYLKGRGGLAQDTSTAVGWFGRAAVLGHVDAAFDLALLYLEGTVLEKDRVKALKWFEKAAENDHTESQYILGLAYQKTDVGKAVFWLEKASASNHAKAVDALGKLCEENPARCD